MGTLSYLFGATKGENPAANADAKATAKAVQHPREIIIKTDRKGNRRAQYLSRQQIRMFPMPIEQADLMISTGEGVLLDRHPITGVPIGKA